MDDVVIIGGGIIWAASAYFLSKEGRKVKVIERDPTYKNASFPLDVTDQVKCKEVFEQIKSHYGDVDICFFSTGTWNPKKEKDIDVEQIENVFKVNFFGTVNSI